MDSLKEKIEILRQYSKSSDLNTLLNSINEKTTYEEMDIIYRKGIELYQNDYEIEIFQNFIKILETFNYEPNILTIQTVREYLDDSNIIIYQQRLEKIRQVRNLEMKINHLLTGLTYKM